MVALCITLVTYWKFSLSNLVALKAGQTPARMWSGLPSRGEHFYSKTWMLGSGVSVTDSFVCCVESCGVINCVYHIMLTDPNGNNEEQIYDSLILLGSNSLNGCDSILFFFFFSVLAVCRGHLTSR